jgi:transcriptional regulator with XRE-family HTH domain
MRKRKLRRASELTEEFLRDPDYRAIYDEVAREEIGAALRAVRESRRLSQSEVAQRMGVNRSRISQIEGTEGTSLSLDVLQRYSQALGCYIDIVLKDLGTNEEVGEVFVSFNPQASEMNSESSTLTE